MNGVRSRPCLRNRDLAALGCGFEHEPARHRTARDLFGVTATLSRRCRSCRRHTRYLPLRGRIRKCGLPHVTAHAGWRFCPSADASEIEHRRSGEASLMLAPEINLREDQPYDDVSYGRICRLLSTGKERADIYRVSQADIMKNPFSPDPRGGAAVRPICARHLHPRPAPGVRHRAWSAHRRDQGQVAGLTLKGSPSSIRLARRLPDASNTAPR